MATNQKPSFVEIWIYNGKEIPLKISQGKVLCGIVSFKEADPGYPVIWLGQKSYRVVNPRSKKNILFYDSLTKALFKPSEMSGLADNVDMVMQMSQNMMMGANAAKEAMGMVDAMSQVKLVAIAGMIILGIIVFTFLYLFYSHIPVPPGSVTTTISQIASNATTTIPHTIGPQIIPPTT